MALGSNTLSISQAQKIALAAQGLAKAKRNRSANWTRIEGAIADMGLLQIDSVNVLTRAHYLPAWSRIGAYSREALDRLAYRDRELFEYWGHEAALLPVALHPLMRWRMQRAGRGWCRSPNQ